MNNPKVSLSALKETLIFYNNKAEIIENQTQNLILKMAELQCKLNPHPFRVSAVKMRALTEKEWDLENWSADICEEPYKAGCIEPLDPDESSLPVKAAMPPPSEEIDATLPEETFITSPEFVALQDIADSSQDSQPPSFIASRPITRLKSQQALKGLMNKVAIMAGMEVMYELSNMDFHSPRLTWLQLLLSVQSASNRDQH
ncbi:Friend virus susceptibility protein 1-like [Homo sapiens]|uniref:Friend virus susceptibility protein 1-like n=1 Tax=Homo sapiens TaxID=9606 RepID=UPI001FB13411|nr:Friend virus susceptibility protein 1-like [Homo sapiens]